MSPHNGILPLYFGPRDRSLFGCYHKPRLERSGKCAVVICQPLGHEYINCHRALRQLAARLADAGFPVLRFDYYGCGDSSGETEDGTISGWLEDVSTALAEVRRRTGIDQTCVVGLRLGATLALMSGALRGEIERLVLWNPVIDGKTYLEELLSLQKEMLCFRPRPKTRQKPEDYIEVLGFPLSNLLCDQLRALDLLRLLQRPAHNVLMLESYPVPFGDTLRNHLSQSEARLEYQVIEATPIWLPTSDGSLHVPFQALQAAVSWISKAYS